MKIGVLTRQLGDNPPVATAVVTEEHAQAYRAQNSIYPEDFNMDNWITRTLEEDKETFLKSFVEFKSARWGITILEIK